MFVSIHKIKERAEDHGFARKVKEAENGNVMLLKEVTFEPTGSVVKFVKKGRNNESLYCEKSLMKAIGY